MREPRGEERRRQWRAGEPVVVGVRRGYLCHQQQYQYCLNDCRKEWSSRDRQHFAPHVRGITSMV